MHETERGQKLEGPLQHRGKAVPLHPAVWPGFCVLAGPRGGQRRCSPICEAMEQDGERDDGAPFRSSCDSRPSSLAAGQLGRPGFRKEGIHPGSPWKNTRPRASCWRAHSGARPERGVGGERLGVGGGSKVPPPARPGHAHVLELEDPWVRGHMGLQLWAERCPPTPKLIC